MATKPTGRPPGRPPSGEDPIVRNREAQRRHRETKRQHIEELEERVRVVEQRGVEISAEIQRAAREVVEENRRLRILLNKRACDDARIEYLLSLPEEPEPPKKGGRRPRYPEVPPVDPNFKRKRAKRCPAMTLENLLKPYENVLRPFLTNGSTPSAAEAEGAQSGQQAASQATTPVAPQAAPLPPISSLVPNSSGPYRQILPLAVQYDALGNRVKPPPPGRQLPPGQLPLPALSAQTPQLSHSPQSFQSPQLSQSPEPSEPSQPSESPQTTEPVQRDASPADSSMSPEPSPSVGSSHSCTMATDVYVLSSLP
ncbi:hypothetical protein B0T17DRAFT_521269 [Bombardia bombarda]|uniref:BZIP domain-containing protein n=1 Tax=Bombardia bombarda TaxID=252184 RepID=A0AA39XNI4_9PEZI|nr:hypothetical protein B0T17DRAFT_521269 [Bombardia bombarda]